MTTLDDWRRWRGCERKRAWKKKHQAEQIARNLSRWPGELTAYKCEYCGAYHIGHDTKEEQQ